jgi:hypothetical protein
VMRPLSSAATVLITAILALLLVSYVFAGSRRGNTDNDPHCTSREPLDLIRGELFRRAAAIRGSREAAFSHVGRYSILRTESPILRRHDDQTGDVTCTGTIVLDLPPGLAVADGRRSLTADAAYALHPTADGKAQLRMLSKVDAVVLPLATLSQAGSAAARRTPAAPRVKTEDPGLTTTKQRALQPVQPSVSNQNRHKLPKADTAVVATPSLGAISDDSRPRKRQATSSRSSNVGTPERSATNRPSFNCRYARTHGEIAVCNNPDLARLDRQMAAQFYRAMSVVRPRQKAMLQRTRARFLSQRDTCGSVACIADSYRSRMREIGDIMAGR